MTSFDDVVAELARARAKYPNFHSSHEGHSLIREELEELWNLVKFDHNTRPSDMPLVRGPVPLEGIPTTVRAEMRAECIQIAAMALRFIEDLCDEGE